MDYADILPHSHLSLPSSFSLSFFFLLPPSIPLLSLQEAKASNLMNLELADYQRSMESLEEKLSAMESQLVESQSERRTQQERMEAIRKETGVCVCVCVCACARVRACVRVCASVVLV